MATAVFLCRGGTYVVRSVLDTAGAFPRRPSARDGGAAEETYAGDPAGADVDTCEYNRGRLIGNIERLLLALVVVVGSYEAIGFLVAAKGLIRAREFEDRDFAEYFIIGTLASGAIPAETGEPLKAYVTREVKQRLHQRRFRYLVLKAYRERCAICALRQEKLLDAAHILPDRDERGNPEVPNGLSLCRIHHGAYDVNIVGVDPDYRLHVRGDVLEEIDGPMLRHGLQELHGGQLLVPRRDADKPDRDYLAERFEEFQAA